MTNELTCKGCHFRIQRRVIPSTLELSSIVSHIPVCGMMMRNAGNFLIISNSQRLGRYWVLKLRPKTAPEQILSIDSACRFKSDRKKPRGKLLSWFRTLQASPQPDFWVAIRLHLHTYLHDFLLYMSFRNAFKWVTKEIWHFDFKSPLTIVLWSSV
jgi:hypothetical protein